MDDSESDAIGLKNGARPEPMYSVCITYRNNGKTVESSLSSILVQLDDRFEVIVVDGSSTDNTFEILKQLQRKYGRLVLVSRPCSRGLGRDIAYRLSKGRYLIQGVDGDIIFNPTLQSVLDYYHSNEKTFGKYVLFIPDAFMISTRESMDEIGGWPDLQYGEDAYIGAKLIGVCTVDVNFILYDTLVERHIRAKATRRLLPRVLLSNYIDVRDIHRYIPFFHMIGSLRQRLREEHSLADKLRTTAIFLLSAVGQYSKVRYKLHGNDLIFYKHVERFRDLWWAHQGQLEQSRAILIQFIRTSPPSESKQIDVTIR